MKSTSKSNRNSSSYRREKLLLGPIALRVTEGALNIAKSERVLIVADTAHRAVGEILGQACLDLGAQVQLIILEHLGKRPHRKLPHEILSLLSNCEASMFIADFVDGEASMRRDFLLAAQRFRVRHAHMLGLSIESLVKGLQTDPRRIERIGMMLLAKLRGKKSLHVRSARGTDLIVDLDNRYRWNIHSGIIARGSWENLPSGELMTHPAQVNGTFVCDVSFSGPLGAKLGIVRNTPVVFSIRDGRVVDLSCSLPEVVTHLKNWMASGRNYDRVGVITLGINVGIDTPTGELICDQNMPGLHLSLGATFPEETNASWDTDGQQVFAGSDQDIDLAGVPLMRFGQYLQMF